MLYDLSFEEVLPSEDALPDAIPTSREVRIPKISAEIPDGISRIMLVVFPDRKSPDGTLFTITLPYESEDLREGMARIYNSTNQLIALQFEDKNGPFLKLEPNRNLVFDPKALFETDYVRVFGYTSDAKGRAQRVHVSKMFFEADKTNFFVMYPQGKRLRMLRLGGHDLSEPVEENQSANSGSPSSRLGY